MPVMWRRFRQILCALQGRRVFRMVVILLPCRDQSDIPVYIQSGLETTRAYPFPRSAFNSELQLVAVLGWPRSG